MTMFHRRGALRRMLITLVALNGLPLPALAADERVLVNMPPMMQEHMLGNMRDHLRAVNDILAALAAGDGTRAAEVAEYRLGMSSLDSHGAAHMAPLMPPGMREAGTAMHTAASRFARVAEEGDLQQGYRVLQEVTAACVACHSGYRIR